MLRRLFFYSLLLCGMCACSHYHYTPNIVPTPFNTEKNSVSVGGYLSEVGFTGIFDLQATYNPFKNVSVFSNYMQVKGRFDGGTLSAEQGASAVRHHYGELGAGGKVPIKNSHVLLGLYSGIGRGSVFNNYGRSHIAQIDFNKWFVQPTFFYQWEVIRLGLGFRFSNVSFVNGRVDVAIPENEYKELQRVDADAPFALLETGVNIGIRFAPVTWTINVIRADILSTSKDHLYGFDLDNLSVGCVLDLDHFFKKRPKAALSK